MFNLTFFALDFTPLLILFVTLILVLIFWTFERITNVPPKRMRGTVSFAIIILNQADNYNFCRPFQ